MVNDYGNQFITTSGKNVRMVDVDEWILRINFYFLSIFNFYVSMKRRAIIVQCIRDTKCKILDFAICESIKKYYSEKIPNFSTFTNLFFTNISCK
jgi:hypothetical protein